MSTNYPVWWTDPAEQPTWYRDAIQGEQMRDLVLRTVALRSQMHVPFPDGKTLPPSVWAALCEEFRQS